MVKYSDKDIAFLKQAYVLAQNSPDPSTQNGAILVKYDRKLGEGVNRFPDGVNYSPERWVRPLKYKWVEHAERNAIFDVARRGNSIQGATLYCPWFACADCARAIIQSGVSRIVGHDCPLHATSTTWKETIEVADTMLTEAGVEFVRIPGVMGARIRFNEKEVDV